MHQSVNTFFCSTHIMTKKGPFLILRVVCIVINSWDEPALLNDRLNAGHITLVVIDEDNVIRTSMLSIADACESKSKKVFLQL